MKILYDYQTFQEQTHGGISRYFTEIIGHLPPEATPFVCAKYVDNVYLMEKKIVDNLLPTNYIHSNFLGGVKFPGRTLIYRAFKKYNPEKYNALYINKKSSLDTVKEGSFDIFHPTYYSDYFLNHIGNKPFVLTIHDMAHELYPEQLSDFPLSTQKKRLAKKAAHIIAVSEKTKKDIIDILDIPENKISVVYHATSLPATQDTGLALPKNYFLYVGGRRVYKNFMFFVRAIEPIIKQRKDISVVCTGSNFNETEIELFSDLNISNNFINIFAKEANMYEIYNKALAFVFPSYCEGFGIPILEAFESSCPVILSNLEPFPEIAKDCALYFSPKDIKQMKSSMETIIDNPPLRESLVNKGKIRAKDFSWSASANQTYEIYKRVLKNE